MTLREVITREFEPVRRARSRRSSAGSSRTCACAPGFREFVELARERGWRFVIVSSGFHELIEPILEHEGVEVELHANRVDPRPEGWRVEWRYDATCDSCGESCKRSIVQAFAGDGELDLHRRRLLRPLRCRGVRPRLRHAGPGRVSRRAGIPYERFDDFHDVARGLAS